MNKYFVRKSATTYANFYVIAANEAEAREIAKEVNVNDTFEETECYDIDYIEESTDEIEPYNGVPVIRAKSGYEIIG